MPIHRDFRDLLKEFNGAKVEYLVVGAYAVSFHAEPRYTKDLDLWINPTPRNAQRVHAALSRFGAPLSKVKVGDFAKPGIVYQMGVEPVRVDILTSVSVLDFARAYRRRLRSSYGGVRISILSIEDLIASKKAAGRPQDLLDVETLKRKMARRCRS